MKAILMLMLLLGGCGATALPIGVPDGGTDALPCWEQPCNPDDAGRCERCPISDDAGR